MYSFETTSLILCTLLTLTTSKQTSPSISVKDSLTCPARTVNYITHSLPQQCLPTSRSSATINKASASNDETPHTESQRSIQSLRSSSKNILQEPLSLSSDLLRSVEHTDVQDSKVTTSVKYAATAETTASTVDASRSSVLPVIVDEDSALEDGRFLSFEDWKKQNLIKVGQPEHVGRETIREQKEGRRRPSAMHGSLDSLGDDAEIDLDFSGLVSGDSPRRDGHVPRSVPNEDQLTETLETDKKPKARSHNKDAGTTSKERFNYASFDCAANVLKSNPQAKSPTSVLVENKDAYMLNICAADNKFLILELCNDLSIDTIVLANFEFFSSIFRQFRVSVSDLYPVKLDKWKILGTFEARNTREVQAFRIDNPVIWARYLRIEFLTHYGNEYYCPVSLVRVHGTTMLEEYKHDLEMNTGDDDDDEEEEAETMRHDPLTTETSTTDSDDRSLRKEIKRQHAGLDHDLDDGVDGRSSASHGGQGADELSKLRYSKQTGSNPITPATTNKDPLSLLLISHFHPMCPVASPPASVSFRSQFEYTHDSDRMDNPYMPRVPISSSQATERTPSISSGYTGNIETSTTRAESRKVISSSQSVNTSNTFRSVSGSSLSSSTITQTSSNGSKSVTTTAGRGKSSSGISAERKTSVSATQPNPASPTMQESFFKSVQKRLQMLESNSSLSLQYIEEQSRSLQDAFRKVEQRQLSKTTKFLDQLNSTVLSELREFRQQYDQLWQSTVIELEIQREQYQRENQAMHARLGVLADELIFQKRISILQMTLILVCLGLVLFSRGLIHNYLDLPLVQSVLSKSPSRKLINLTGDTPSSTPPLSRRRSAQQLRARSGVVKGHRRSQSNELEEIGDDTISSTDLYSPPTPISFDGFSDSDHYKEDARTDTDIEFDPSMIERPSTSPPILPGSHDSSSPVFSRGLEFDTIETRILGSPGSSAGNDNDMPHVHIEEATPPSKHLTWDLP